MRATTIIAFGIAWLSAAAADAQPPVPVRTRIRVVYAENDSVRHALRRFVVGPLVAWNDDRLVIGREPAGAVAWGLIRSGPWGGVTAAARHPPLSIAHERVLELHASAGVHRARGFWTGALIGGVVGATLATLGSHRCGDGVELICGIDGAGEVGALIGTSALLGGVPGLLLAPERWRRVR
jgi:hypothetical protein